MAVCRAGLQEWVMATRIIREVCLFPSFSRSRESSLSKDLRALERLDPRLRGGDGRKSAEECKRDARLDPRLRGGDGRGKSVFMSLLAGSLRGKDGGGQFCCCSIVGKLRVRETQTLVLSIVVCREIPVPLWHRGIAKGIKVSRRVKARVCSPYSPRSQSGTWECPCLRS